MGTTGRWVPEREGGPKRSGMKICGESDAAIVVMKPAKAKTAEWVERRAAPSRERAGGNDEPHTEVGAHLP